MSVFEMQRGMSLLSGMTAVRALPGLASSWMLQPVAKLPSRRLKS